MVLGSNHELCPVEENVLQLRQAYCKLLLKHRPGTVLDVGCGGGQVMQMLAEQGVHCTGVENGPPSENLNGFEFVQASAEALPFAADSFDWVSMRHIPHHLAQPQRALAEAIRIARHGLLIAEPIFDRNHPAQALAEDVDLWLKRQHRREGRVHNPNLSLQQIRALMQPLGAAVSLWEHFPPSGNRDGSNLIAEINNYSAQLPSTRSDVSAGQDLIQRIQETPVSWNGSLCVIAERLSSD